jgi:hypothetical protein
MNTYNAAFFGLYENWFKTIKKEFGENEALRLFRTVMEEGLSQAYGSDFDKGSTKEFVRLVGERDQNVGLEVSFPMVEQDKLIYRFHTDPFPHLKGVVDSHRLDDTYIRFKVNFILGQQWHYENVCHIWSGASYTEFLIQKM